MIMAAGILVGSSTFGDGAKGPVPAATMAGYVTGFVALFILSGIGNGSAYRMIASIFREQRLSEAKSKGETDRTLALKEAGLEAAAALGFIGGVGACGGYLIPSGFGASRRCITVW